MEIIHNYEKRAMINISTINGEEFRQEVNPWFERHSKIWVIDKVILI